MATRAAKSASHRSTRPPARRGERTTATGRRLRAVEPSSRARHLAPFLFASALLIGGLVLLVVITQALVAQTSFRIQDLTQRDDALGQEYGQLRLQIAQLSSPHRIAVEARRLGLRLPDPTEVKTIQVDEPARAGASRPGDVSSSMKGVLGSSP
ncbi:MAG TPA: hypothetical protein VF972_02510 [Actinomycetota bacterium]